MNDRTRVHATFALSPEPRYRSATRKLPLPGCTLLLEVPASTNGKLKFADLARAGFHGVFILGRLNRSSLASLCCKPPPGEISAHNIPHGSVYLAGFAGHITLISSMNRFLTCLLTCLLSVGVVRADDLWATAVAERPRDGWKIIHRFIEKLESPSEKLEYPIAVTFTWKYEGPNGMPKRPDTEAIYKLEDVLESRVEKRREGKLAVISMGNNLRTWTYYVKSEASFRKELAEASAALQLGFDTSSRSDPKWARLEELKNSVRRP